MRNMSLEKGGLMIEARVTNIVQLCDPITVAMVAQIRQAWEAEMRSKLLDPTKPFDKPKAVIVKYRRVKSVAPCTIPIDQFNVMMEAAIRTIAADEGLLSPMWCEGNLVEKWLHPVGMEMTSCWRVRSAFWRHRHNSCRRRRPVARTLRSC